MRITFGLLALAAVFAIGCGGDDTETTNEPQAQTAIEVPAEAADALDGLSTSLHRLELLAASADCKKIQQLRRERTRMRRLTDQLSRYEDHPAAGDDIANIGAAVHDADVSIKEALATCRDQRELEQAADEARRLADEIDP